MRAENNLAALDRKQGALRPLPLPGLYIGAAQLLPPLLAIAQEGNNGTPMNFAWAHRIMAP